MTAVDNTEEFLAHFGIKGMKWGRRNSESKARDARQDKEDAANPPKQTIGARVKGAGSNISKKIQDDPERALLIGATAAAGAAFLAKNRDIISGTVKVGVALGKTGWEMAKREEAKKFAGRMLAGTGSHLSKFAKVTNNVANVTTLR